jgi:integrase
VTKIDLLKLIDDARGLRPHTKRGYTNTVKQWLDFAGADPAGWTPLQAQAFYDHLITSGLSVETVNNMTIGGLTFVFKRAAQLYGIPNPGPAIDKYRADGEKARRALTGAQGRALIEVCTGPTLMDLRDHAILIIGLYTGMRRMSLTSIDLESVTDHGAFVTLKVIIKGGRAYNVPLDARAWALTAAYRQALHVSRGAGTGPLFTSLRVNLMASPTERYAPIARITEDGLLRAIGKRAEVAKVKHFSPHIMRHTFITWCRAEPAKIEPQFVGTITGHEDRARERSYAMIEHYTDKTSLARDAARRCYEAVTAKLASDGKDL